MSVDLIKCHKLICSNAHLLGDTAFGIYSLETWSPPEWGTRQNWGPGNTQPLGSAQAGLCNQASTEEMLQMAPVGSRQPRHSELGIAQTTNCNRPKARNRCVPSRPVGSWRKNPAVLWGHTTELGLALPSNLSPGAGDMLWCWKHLSHSLIKRSVIRAITPSEGWVDKSTVFSGSLSTKGNRWVQDNLLSGG